MGSGVSLVVKIASELRIFLNVLESLVSFAAHKALYKARGLAVTVLIFNMRNRNA